MEDKYVNLNKVYTKTGDKGETSLVGGTRVKKSSIKVDCYGEIDETSSVLGLVRVYCKNEEIKKLILDIQEKLLIVGAHLASDEKGKTFLKESITEENINFIEAKIDFYNNKLEPLFKFILPGDDILSSYIHLARTVVRRAERRIVELSFQEEIDDNIQKYINRLSDLFFVLARFVSEIKYEE